MIELKGVGPQDGNCEICGIFLAPYDTKFIYYSDKKRKRCTPCLDLDTLWKQGKVNRNDILMDGWYYYTDG